MVNNKDEMRENYGRILHFLNQLINIFLMIPSSYQISRKALTPWCLLEWGLLSITRGVYYQRGLFGWGSMG